jgi:hypothetical protein
MTVTPKMRPADRLPKIRLHRCGLGSQRGRYNRQAPEWDIVRTPAETINQSEQQIAAADAKGGPAYDLLGQ